MTTGNQLRVSFDVSDNAAMRDMAASLARRCRGSEIFSLHGDLGAGKTEFVRGLASGFQSLDAVASPTFTLHNIYQGDRTLHHYDFYRIFDDPGLLKEELAEALADPAAVTAIEWGDPVAEIVPAERTIQIHISVDPQSETARTVVCEVPRRCGYLLKEAA